LAYLKNLSHGLLYAFNDEPDKALNTLRLAFGDENSAKYLANVFVPPTREGVDLRSLVVEALDRINKSISLPADLQKIRRDWDNVLHRTPPTPGKAK
jgi:hypothetical protein